MNIKGNKLSLSPKMYPAFQKGSETDKDVIARACGFDSGMTVLSFECSFEYMDLNYEIKIDFGTQGEQRLVDEIEDVEELAKKIKASVDEIENTLSNANKCKINDSLEVEIFTQMCNECQEMFRNNCWYEGDITLKRVNPDGTKETIVENYESDLGLEGVYGSVKEIEDNFSNSEVLKSYLEYVVND